MKFKDPYIGPQPATGLRSGASRGPNQWLKEWLDNQGRYVELKCGCYEDLNDKALLVIGTFNASILCERCNAWTSVRKPVRFQQYKGLPAAITPDEPLF